MLKRLELFLGIAHLGERTGDLLGQFARAFDEGSGAAHVAQAKSIQATDVAAWRAIAGVSLLNYGFHNALMEKNGSVKACIQEGRRLAQSCPPPRIPRTPPLRRPKKELREESAARIAQGVSCMVPKLRQAARPGKKTRDRRRRQKMEAGQAALRGAAPVANGANKLEPAAGHGGELKGAAEQFFIGGAEFSVKQSSFAKQKYNKKGGGKAWGNADSGQQVNTDISGKLAGGPPPPKLSQFQPKLQEEENASNLKEGEKECSKNFKEAVLERSLELVASGVVDASFVDGLMHALLESMDGDSAFENQAALGSG
ncbi:unnamed protein product [Prorocentrum cordatum]|uniref:Uncharacterized protein n=1 Tax=Prorocentrum cordatum TaxID=2364126 RepID=A0ABN9XSJ9_9DINO|nr:unnamed protein product [Polarella glacialis]